MLIAIVAGTPSASLIAVPMVIVTGASMVAVLIER
jgi:hypothetical protein